MAFYSRYVLLRLPAAGLPIRLRFRNATVLLEITRDCSAIVPTWVLAARKLASRGDAGGRVATPSPHSVRSGLARTYATDHLTGCRLPTVAPIQRQRSAFAQSSDEKLILVTSLFGRSHLERTLRAGVVLQDGCAAARVLDAVVKLGYARRERASGRDV